MTSQKCEENGECVRAQRALCMCLHVGYRALICRTSLLHIG